MRQYFLILSGVVLFISGNSVFAQWQELYRWQDAISYIDLKQIRRSGDVVQLPQLVDYQLPKFTETQPVNEVVLIPSAKVAVKLASTSYKSLITVMEFNCKTRQSREIVYYFTQNMAKGTGEHRLPIEVGASRFFDPSKPVDLDEVLKLALSKTELKKEEQKQESGWRSALESIFKSESSKSSVVQEPPKLSPGWSYEQPWQKGIREMACVDTQVEAPKNE